MKRFPAVFLRKIRSCVKEYVGTLYEKVCGSLIDVLRALSKYVFDESEVTVKVVVRESGYVTVPLAKLGLKSTLDPLPAGPVAPVAPVLVANP
jgi:hypothetical protein